jgi:type III restriction enzyme
MLNSLISGKAAAWFQREDCPAQQIVAYIEQAGFLRDAQIEAIKTYLFLKIAGGNRPLWQLFCDGFFLQNEDLSRLHISAQARALFETDQAARALFQFARRKADGSVQAALPSVESYLLDHAGEVDCKQLIQSLFYGVQYPDYLFSLPMGAGKTFLMAAFIYLDLYFAQNEPGNSLFAHNFVLLVPSGLKSSILPSLKTIENFDPAWVLPEPAASSIRKLMKFEVLDQAKSGSRSNKARNPNAQKVSQYQPFDDLMGLVLVTNAEKVILDKVKIDPNGQLDLLSADEKDKESNELRNLISKVPNLQILIDEVHHAATDDIKLRQVVNNWSLGGSINGVLGFSGTPYLSSSDTLPIADGLSIKSSQITNTVFYYPLTRAIQNFLKKPSVHTISGLDSQQIVQQGVSEFLAQYGGKTYAHGATAKLAIYCGSIERLEEDIYPLLLQMGVPADDILKYHRGNTDHKISPLAEAEFKSLDTSLSRKRIVLLVQIGKEGWDCRSLTGVVLAQKGDCPSNMVLQTSCRCLRQMDGGYETAGIWLNADNAKTLDKQLAEEQQTSIDEINKLGKGDGPPLRERFSRMDHLKLPLVEFYQLQVKYQAVTHHDAAPQASLSALKPAATNAFVRTGGLASGSTDSLRFHDQIPGEPADFSAWLLSVSKGSFDTLKMSHLRRFTPELRAIFDGVTYTDSDLCRFNALYDLDILAADIRLAFHARRELSSSSEILREDARLLVVEKLKALPVSPKLYPSEAETTQMREMDASGQNAYQYAQAQQAKLEAVRETLRAQGLDPNLFTLPAAEPTPALNSKERSFHFVPYNFDSGFELDFLREALTLDALKDRSLELYFNGAGDLTEFRIDCFARRPHGWSKVGKYTPDFLLVERKDGAISRALIIETKGSGFADQKAFAARRKFVETEFLPQNNQKFGYPRFDYLYLSDADPLPLNLRKLSDAATAFFTQ